MTFSFNGSNTRNKLSTNTGSNPNNTSVLPSAYRYVSRQKPRPSKPPSGNSDKIRQYSATTLPNSIAFSGYSKWFKLGSVVLLK